MFMTLLVCLCTPTVWFHA
uniref:Uncharacterized protein n=1 Tax=Arundo donax TaxID=35708 RepID=A0A0A9A5Q7_ARUDO